MLFFLGKSSPWSLRLIVLRIRWKMSRGSEPEETARPEPIDGGTLTEPPPHNGAGQVTG